MEIVAAIYGAELCAYIYFLEELMFCVDKGSRAFAYLLIGMGRDNLLMIDSLWG